MKIQPYIIFWRLYYIYQLNESTATNQNSLIVTTDFIHHILKEDNIIRSREIMILKKGQKIVNLKYLKFMDQSFCPKNSTENYQKSISKKNLETIM